MLLENSFIDTLLTIHTNKIADTILLVNVCRGCTLTTHNATVCISCSFRDSKRCDLYFHILSM